MGDFPIYYCHGPLGVASMSTVEVSCIKVPLDTGCLASTVLLLVTPRGPVYFAKALYPSDTKFLHSRLLWLFKSPIAYVMGCWTAFVISSLIHLTHTANADLSLSCSPKRKKINTECNIASRYLAQNTQFTQSNASNKRLP